MKKESGFIQIILIIIIIAIVLLFFGKSPVALWEIIKPFIVFIFELFLALIDWLLKLVTFMWERS